MKRPGPGAVRLLLVLLLVALLMPQTAEATHSRPRLMLSRDGHHWTTHLRAPLFDPRVTWIPGTRQAARFYVRNDSGGRATLKIVVRVTDTNHVLRPGGVRMKIHTGTDTMWRHVRRAGQTVAALRTMPAGRVLPVEVRAREVLRAGRRTMDTQLHFTVRVRLTRLTKHGGGHR